MPQLLKQTQEERNKGCTFRVRDLLGGTQWENNALIALKQGIVFTKQGGLWITYAFKGRVSATPKRTTANVQ